MVQEYSIGCSILWYRYKAFTDLCVGFSFFVLTVFVLKSVGYNYLPLPDTCIQSDLGYITVGAYTRFIPLGLQVSQRLLNYGDCNHDIIWFEWWTQSTHNETVYPKQSCVLPWSLTLTTLYCINKSRDICTTRHTDKTNTYLQRTLQRRTPNTHANIIVN